MKSLKTLIVVALISVNALPALAFTEITSAPETILSNSTLEVSKGCILLTRAWDLDDSSAEIQQLSEYLKKKGFYNGKAVKKYTKAIKTAVAKFQLENEIIKNENSEVLGVMTATTREFISKDTCAKKDIETPKTSCVYITRSLNTSISNNPVFADDTRTLQRFLVQKGYLSSTFVTGSFGALTKEALRRFQIDNGIIASSESEGAGELGPRTREFIQLNTCGKADVEKTTDAKRIGYRVSLSTRTGVVVDGTGAEQVLRVNIKPQEQNAQLKSLTLQLAASSTNPTTYIDGFELYSKGKIISRTRGANIFKAVSGSSNNYQITLDGSTEYLSRGEEFDLNVRVIPKTGVSTLSPKDFSLFVPKDGLVVQFSTDSGVVKGDETWGNESQKSTFKIGKVENSTTSSTGSVSSDDGSDSTTDENTVVNDTVAVKKLELKAVNPDNISFGQNIILRGSGFDPLNNKIKLFHPQTGATRMVAGQAARDNKIEFKFLGVKGDMTRPNGKKVSGLTGNYRISVIVGDKESNSMVFRVTK
jgi:peptidoglycan hydrolase-like protein with peptidoglycan-binding domain